LKALSELSDDAALIMVNVHLYYELNLLPSNIGQPSSDFPFSPQKHFNDMHKILMSLSHSSNKTMAHIAQTLLVNRCKESSKIFHNWPEDHCEEWKNDIEIMKKQLKAKDEKESLWLTTERCYQTALTCMFCLNGQSQDLDLAARLLKRIEKDDEKATFYLNIIEQTRTIH